MYNLLENIVFGSGKVMQVLAVLLIITLVVANIIKSI